MAHQSGYGGMVKFNALVDSPTSVHPAYTLDVPEVGDLDLVRFPGTNSGTVQQWTLNQNLDNFEAYAKGDVWVTTFGTASEWDADLTVLVPAELATAANMQPGSYVNIQLLLNSVDYFKGQAFISGITFDDPLDGPVTARIKVTGCSNSGTATAQLGATVG